MTIEVLEARAVPLGGARALTVHRTLPQRGRTLVGAWCFADAYGPTPHAAAMDLPAHPHTGLQTVSWLYAGEIEHRDSTGARALVRPGQVNLMTAGAGISHSETSTAAADALHGVQLWLALPDAHRGVAPFFEHAEPEPFALGAATVRVFVGELAGRRAAVTTFSPLVGAQVDVPAGATVRVPVDPAAEHGLLVDAGEATFQGQPVAPSELGVVAAGASELTITAGTAVRALLLGGVPLGEQIVMWWNFVGRSHDEVAAFRRQWQADVIDGGDPHGRFGTVAHPAPPLPAPELPTVRLRPRA
ncbi:pirin family protein [Pseudonocardia sp. CA-107938]|uniref:pirin family protein n=1 Tax=Pseudonocardia sp. CA-107938 TaxID=3240021 RepID=UPI003D91F368